MGGGMEIERKIWAQAATHLNIPVMMETEWDLDTTLDQQTEDDQEDLVNVIIHNDDVTPMDFVVIILQRIFQLTPLEAEHVMITAHLNGLALVATLPESEAKKRVGKAHFAAQLEGYPLMFTIEPA
jgi:ATP-dependent Clp protease adaptor protein ClpS